MEGSQGFAGHVAPVRAAVLIASCTGVIPSRAYADQDTSNDTAVFVVLEQAEDGTPSTSEYGNIVESVEVNHPFTLPPDSLPQTGDPMGSLIGIAVLAGFAALLVQLKLPGETKWQRRNGRL